jgi:hypothetical protein
VKEANLMRKGENMENSQRLVVELKNHLKSKIADVGGKEEVKSAYAAFTRTLASNGEI